MAGRDVYLVGSVPMANSEQVFEAVSGALGRRIKRIPDGETGQRGDWITWLEPVFAASPALLKSGEFFRVHASGTGRERYSLRPGRKPEDLHFENLHYADFAKESFAVFKRLKAAGKIAAETKFQIDVVPAHSVIWLYLVDALHAPVDPIYNEAVKREIDKIAAALPHDEIAIQFDVASAVFARLERNQASSYGRTKEETQQTFSNILIELGNHVPGEHRSAVPPLLRRFQPQARGRADRHGGHGGVCQSCQPQIARPIQLIHMPVPRNRADDAYFQPLRNLKLRSETQLCLGLVHHTDGIEGTKKRIATAKKYVSGFAVGTECGFGRRDPKTIPELLRIHAQIADQA